MRYILGPSLAALAVTIALAQSSTPSNPEVETAHVTIVTSSNAATAAAAGKISLVVEITPKPKMHLYAPGEKDGIPVTLTIEANPAIKTTSPPRYPPAERFFFAPLKLTQLVFSKPFRITQPIAIVGRPAEALTIKGALRYQACDDAVCYLPKSVGVSWTLLIR